MTSAVAVAMLRSAAAVGSPPHGLPGWRSDGFHGWLPRLQEECGSNFCVFRCKNCQRIVGADLADYSTPLICENLTTLQNNARLSRFFSIQTYSRLFSSAQSAPGTTVPHNPLTASRTHNRKTLKRTRERGRHGEGVTR
jgi:hypothetical protein